MTAVGVAKLADLVFTLALAGLERIPVVEKVREMEEKGASPDEITDALQEMRKASEAVAQKKVDDAA